MISNDMIPDDIDAIVGLALAEDIGKGDITAKLVPESEVAHATLFCRDKAVLCGIPWANAVFSKVDAAIKAQWLFNDSDHIAPNTVIAHVQGPARSLLTAERTTLNFLQTLSGTATKAHHYAQLVSSTPVKLLDTRKTLPGLRTAQKYAVVCGGCHNHRMGLYDAFLIKENHIKAAGSITSAINAAHAISPGKPVEVEVETLDELQEAISAKADIIMLDNFTIEMMTQAVKLNQGRARLEASGGINESSILAVARTGVDYISIGGLTKDVQAIDLSMRMQ